MTAYCVELIGPNGSGKQSIAQYLSTGTSVSPHMMDLESVSTMAEYLPLKTIRILRHSAALASIAAVHRRDRKFYKLMALRNTLVELARAHHPLVLIDEGPRHGIISHIARTHDPAAHLALKALRPIDLVVFIDATTELLVQRLQRKPPAHWVHSTAASEVEARVDRYRATAQSLDLRCSDLLYMQSNSTPVEVLGDRLQQKISAALAA